MNLADPSDLIRSIISSAGGGHEPLNAIPVGKSTFVIHGCSFTVNSLIVHQEKGAMPPETPSTAI